MSNIMVNNDKIVTRGVVTKLIPGTKFEVKTDIGYTTCVLSGKLKINNIKILLDDEVDVEVSPYDLTRGRVIWRHK